MCSPKVMRVSANRSSEYSRFAGMDGPAVVGREEAAGAGGARVGGRVVYRSDFVAESQVAAGRVRIAASGRGRVCLTCGLGRRGRGENGGNESGGRDGDGGPPIQ